VQLQHQYFFEESSPAKEEVSLNHLPYLPSKVTESTCKVGTRKQIMFSQ
jgi:hypothetical protein